MISMSNVEVVDRMQAIPTLGVIGVGLIGGSFAAALRASGSVQRIIGAGRQSANIQVALDRGLIDANVDIETLARESDVILLAMPVGQTAHVLQDILPFLKPHALVMDVGSTKQAPIADARRVLGERIGQFIPAHPIAGSEKSGAEAARADLYEQRTVVLTPLEENSSTSLALAEALWLLCGAKVIQMPAKQHDHIYASVSHLPHWFAYAYMTQVAQASDADLRLLLAGTGFRDFTRLAGSSPEMWRDIFLTNKTAMLAEIKSVQSVLDHMLTALQTDDAAGLDDYLKTAYNARGQWLLQS